MGLVEKSRLLADLSPPLDNLLATQLLDEFISAERRFVQRDWDPAQLDGGQFCEVAARIWYSMDSGTVNRTKEFEECVKYLENETAPHAISLRRDAIHVARVLRTAYKFRSQRGGVHITPHYSSNHMDSRLVVECVRWVMMETLRRFWLGDRELVAKAIRELLQFDVPAVGVFEAEIIVQRTDLSGDEELLVLLHFAGEEGFTQVELTKASRFSKQSVSTSLATLEARSCRQIIRLSNGKFRLTDLGSKRIRDELAEKLILGG